VPLLGHVAGDRRRADDHAGSVADRRHGDRDRDHRSVLADVVDLKVFDSLAALDPGQDGMYFAGSTIGSQDAGALAYDLLAGVAVHPLGRRVPARDDAPERATDDGIVGRVDDRRGELRVLDRHLLFGHRGHRRDHQQDVPGVDLGHTDVHREVGSIP